MRTQIAIFVAIVQSILLFGHFVIYETWIELWSVPGAVGGAVVADRFGNPLGQLHRRVAG